LALGDDGHYYVRGLAQRVRLTLAGDVFSALDEQGTRYTFGLVEWGGAGPYAWHLTEVRSARGDVSELSYFLNASGRAFVEAIRWGGRGTTRAYEAKITYE